MNILGLISQLIGIITLRLTMTNTRKASDGKLGPNWERPYKVASLAGLEAYRLQDMDGKTVPRP